MEAPTNVNWSADLEGVLNDGDALEMFMNWMRSDNSGEHALRLHYAIKAYRDMVERGDQRSTKLAKDIYNKFLRPEQGVCAFIERTVCEAIGENIRKMSNRPNASVFDLCAPYVEAFLRKQHELFVRSDEYIEFLNGGSAADSKAKPSGSSTSRSASSKKQRKSTSDSMVKLTAEALIRSQYDRETALAQSSVAQMFPATRYPYVCHATTSQNDSSAVSSSFSGNVDAQRSGDPKALRRDDKRKQIGPSALATDNRLCPVLADRTNLFRHDSREERERFARSLMEKLEALNRKLIRQEEDNEQLRRLHRRGKCSAKEVVLAGEVSRNIAPADSDDDVDMYVRQMQGSGNDSGKPSPLQFSPGTIPHPISGRRRSPKSHSPERTMQSMLPMPPLMSQSYAAANPYRNNDFAPPPPGFSAPNSAAGGPSKWPYYRTTRLEYDGETSGIASMATTNWSAPSVSYQMEKQRAAMFQKARELSSATSGTHASKSRVTPPRRSGNDFSSLPRPKKINNGQGVCTATGTSPSQQSQQKLTISYRDATGVPVVANVPYKPNLTLKEFRKYLSISSKHRKQFFFKTQCEDNSAPYQLLLVDEDSAILPVFEGKITAECKSLPDSE